ncbi:type IV toxin-antitoxin system AbiEi family antitoxin domain-containing protein [Nocardioides acrostichi]|uniref:Type IV toxin-antitoxin system AbiEi family antitoxin domain-containing protein n=1 Tax=Nocardioides acrostichi TaxID=2784339 RepID=A0A930UYB1_9ACTN|nr:type IV toxin-antitoxin system AbiEi family antitoxin domain-containing protein [Nocardioides acrostichi]MBF4160486.1 type IV toxin-antitoxin system AbiEi family antitoxin domain-containing protein [Nocardioides acrostichi]
MAMIFDLGHSVPRDRPFTRAEARDCGLKDLTLHRMVEHGWLRRPLKGVYVVGTMADTLDLRCAMLRLVVPDDAYVCDHTAAWLHRGDDALPPNDHLKTPDVSCFRPSGKRVRRGGVLSGERKMTTEDVMEVGGLRVTTPLRTACDVGRLGFNNDIRLHALDMMLATDTFTRERLARETSRFKGMRGVVALRALAALADGGSASFGESALRLRWHQAGLPRATTQIEVERSGGGVYYLDLGLARERFAAEYDGRQWHRDQEQREHDAARRRELRELGWRVQVFAREHVFGRQQDAETRLRTAWSDHGGGRTPATTWRGVT